MKMKMRDCCFRIPDREEGNDAKKRRKANCWHLLLFFLFWKDVEQRKSQNRNIPKSLKIGISVYDQYDTLWQRFFISCSLM